MRGGGVAPQTIPPRSNWATLIVICYVALFISVLAGIRVLYILTIKLSEIRNTDDDAVPVVTAVPSIRKAAFMQHSAFSLGILSLGVHSITQLFI